MFIHLTYFSDSKSKKACHKNLLKSTEKEGKSPLDDISEAVFMLPDISKFVQMSESFKQILISEFLNISTQELLIKSGMLIPLLQLFSYNSLIIFSSLFYTHFFKDH